MANRRNNLFDPRKIAGPGGSESASDVASSDTAAGGCSVSILVARIKTAISKSFPSRVTVVGEISNFKRHSSGHLYFSLKDSNCSIDAVMWRKSASKCKFTPIDGMEVLVEGRVDIYDVSGRLQLYVEQMTPKGTGALELAFRQLQGQLAAEGLFDPERKKPIPRYPMRIGVVSSPTGAAIRDISRTLRRRWGGIEIYLIGVRVQGEHARWEIASAITALDLNAKRLGIDTIIISRGGGSIEDLWPFNEPIVARAIFNASIPIISGIGHEVDITISDLVADKRAATPTAAAELATCDRREVTTEIKHLLSRLSRGVETTVNQGNKSLDALEARTMFRDPPSLVRVEIQHTDAISLRLSAALTATVTDQRRRLDPTITRLARQHPALQIQRCESRLEKLANKLRWSTGSLIKTSSDTLGQMMIKLASIDPAHSLSLARQRVNSASRQLEAMSYRSVLSRGFSVTRTASGKILRSANTLTNGTLLTTELADGTFTSKVAEPETKKILKPIPTKKKPAQATRQEQAKLF